jgi:hypothetical protein
MTRYTLHGLTIDSDVTMHAPAASPNLQTEVTVRNSPTLTAPQNPNDTYLYDQPYEGGAWHQVHQQNGKTYVMYRDVAVFCIGENCDSIEYRWLSHAPEHLGPILLEGYVMGLLLTLRGRLVLHASAVSVADGRALALVGPSGAGKTTLAALLVAAGRTHLADDIVGVDLSVADKATISTGSRAIRLREKAWEIESLLPAQHRSVSVDRRLVLENYDCEAGNYQLAALWLPVPDRTIDTVRIEPIDGVVAFQQILPNLRVELNDSGFRRRSFDAVIELTKRVPTSVARIPWGPPWLPSTISQLRTSTDHLGKAAMRTSLTEDHNRSN